MMRGVDMENISIAVLCSTLSVLISYLTFNKNGKKDAQKQTEEQVELRSKLEYISRGIDDIKLDNRVRDEQIKNINERIIVLENEVSHIKEKI